LADDIPALWSAPTTTTADRKKLVRAVVERVTVTAEGESETCHATVVWAGGHQTPRRPGPPRRPDRSTVHYQALTERITVLGE